MTVVTRFPPSPTGFMHIGNARTALFNWLYARHHGGKMVLRIEDTDKERSTKEAVDVIFEAMEWMGLDYDGDAVFQSKNLERHTEIAKALIDKGQAYYCYCSPEELEDMRQKSEGAGPYYDRRWRDRDPSEAPADIKPVVRIKAPLEGETVIDDQVQGRIKVDHSTLDDFIILRSDGSPTYMLSVVVDDYDMGITHIIRGNDHMNNAFRQKVIYDAMGWDVPAFAHLPLIHGTDGSKFSKRHGAQGMHEYRDMGYLPEAMNNYLLRLGWSHGDEEIIAMQQAIKWFTLDTVGKSPARFDLAKLDHLNSHYLREADDRRLLDLILPILEKDKNLAINDIVKQRLLAGMHNLKQRVKTLIQLAEDARFYAFKMPVIYDDAASDVLNEQAAQTLRALRDRLEGLEDFTDPHIEQACKDIAAEMHDGKFMFVGKPFRAALTGSTKSPPLAKVAEILGLEEVSHRIDLAIEWQKSRSLKLINE